MPRHARRVEPNRPHHVVLRGNNGRRLFSFASDYLRLLAFVQRALDPGRCFLNSIVLMSNHIHMLVTPVEAPHLAQFVKSFAQRYSQYRNRRRGGSGKIFDERFYSRVVQDDLHYGCTLAYIDDNPRRAGLVLHPKEYRWSSYHVYAPTYRPDWKRAMQNLITPATWYLDLGINAADRMERYAEWVEDCWMRARHPAHADEVDRIASGHGLGPRRVRRPDDTRAT